MKNSPQNKKALPRPAAIIYLLNFIIFSAQGQDLIPNYPAANTPGYGVYGVYSQNRIPGTISLSAYPNPAIAEVNLLFTSTKDKLPYEMRIIDNSGAQLAVTKGSTRKGDNVVKLNVGNYARGIYYVQFITSRGMGNLKLLKQ